MAETVPVVVWDHATGIKIHALKKDACLLVDPPEIRLHFDSFGIKIMVRLRRAVAGGARSRRI